MDKIEKRCKKCNSVRYMDDFYKNKCTTDGYQVYCKQCQSATAKITQQKNRIKHQKPVARGNPMATGMYVLTHKNRLYPFFGKRAGNYVSTGAFDGAIICRWDECKVLTTIWEPAK